MFEILIKKFEIVKVEILVFNGFILMILVVIFMLWIVIQVWLIVLCVRLWVIRVSMVRNMR